jgi:hypothetical protein
MTFKVVRAPESLCAARGIFINPSGKIQTLNGQHLESSEAARYIIALTRLLKRRSK